MISKEEIKKAQDEGFEERKEMQKQWEATLKDTAARYYENPATILNLIKQGSHNLRMSAKIMEGVRYEAWAVKFIVQEMNRLEPNLLAYEECTEVGTDGKNTYDVYIRWDQK